MFGRAHVCRLKGDIVKCPQRLRIPLAKITRHRDQCYKFAVLPFLISLIKRVTSLTESYSESPWKKLTSEPLWLAPTPELQCTLPARQWTAASFLPSSNGHHGTDVVFNLWFVACPGPVSMTMCCSPGPLKYCCFLSDQEFFTLKYITRFEQFEVNSESAMDSYYSYRVKWLREGEL